MQPSLILDLATAGIVRAGPTSTGFTIVAWNRKIVTVDVTPTTAYAEYGVSHATLANVEAGRDHRRLRHDLGNEGDRHRGRHRRELAARTVRLRPSAPLGPPVRWLRVRLGAETPRSGIGLLGAEWAFGAERFERPIGSLRSDWAVGISGPSGASGPSGPSGASGQGPDGHWGHGPCHGSGHGHCRGRRNHRGHGHDKG